jgi:hypothetical protein
VRAHLKTVLRGGLMVAAPLLLALVVLAPFASVFRGGDIDLGPVRILATVIAVCGYGLLGLAGLDIRGSRPRASLLSSIVVALSGLGLLTALFAIWPGAGITDHETYQRWAFAGVVLALTLVAVAVGMLRRSIEG